VLAEHHTALREMALYRLHDPESFWDKLESLPTVKSPIPAAVLASLRRALPERGTQGEDRPSRRRTREPGAPAVRRARRVARGAGRAGGKGTRSLGREDPL